MAILKNILLSGLLVLFGVLNGISVMAMADPITDTCSKFPDAGPKAMNRLAKTKQPDRGPLWEVVKDGRRSFLYGTLHVAKLEWDFPGPTIKKALNASQEIAVELDTTNPTLGARMNAPMEINNAAPASAEFIALAARVSEQFRRACLDEANFGSADLSSKVLSLTFLSARDAGLFPDFAIDSSLIGYARITGKKITELETSDEQRRVIGGANPTSIEGDIARLESGEAREQLIKLGSAWADGDFAEIERYFSWCNCADEKAEISRLLDDRNAVLAERIAHIYEKRDDVFAAIGVLHMINPGNVIDRLQRMGYSVRQLTARAQP